MITDMERRDFQLDAAFVCLLLLCQLWNKRENQLRNMQNKMEDEYLIRDLEGAFEEASCGERPA